MARIGMRDAFEKLLSAGELTVFDRIDLPGHEERRLPVPGGFCHGPVGRWLRSDRSLKGTLWRHQALALEAIAATHNVVLATGTASGKSLVFQAAAIRALELDPERRILVFYPLKALAADQRVSWSHALREAGLSDGLVGTVTGDTLPDDRRDALEEARILISTPDVCHAWLMRDLANPLHKRFLGRLDMVVLDEAHVLEAVFGSNVAFLFRRLHGAARFCRPKGREDNGLQVIAASATISNPSEHLHALTGLDFVVVGEEDDGSPRFPRSLVHVACRNGDPSSIIPQIQRELIEGSSEGGFITFVDSRQGVERLAIQTEHAMVQPYRSGYEARDRAQIETALRGGTLRGVVATSALELGINIPHFAVGFNLGIPASRKAFRQRFGRIGRTRAGAFAVFADPQAFARYGSSLQEYYEGSVEPSHLYLYNRFMQFAHAKCLAEELEMLGASKRPVPPCTAEWPKGFLDVFEFARVGGSKARPREFDHIARIGGDAPHINYPLRNVGEESFVIGQGHGPNQRIGTVNLQQAIREAYPGAIYLHMARRWRVAEWRNTVWDRGIRVTPWRAPIFTRPLIRTFVNFAVDREGVVAGNFRKSDHGFLAECQLQITERVEGFVERNERKMYRDLRRESPSMTSKTRDFRTTGVVLRIEAEWGNDSEIKRQLADALRDVVIREYSISSQDIGAAATNIAMVADGQRQAVSNAIVLYDATYGSLRLTEPVFVNLGHLIGRLERSSELTSDEDALVPSRVAAQFRDWFEGLGVADPRGVAASEDQAVQATPGGLLWVVAPGGVVAIRDSQGVLRDIEVVCPEFISIGGPPKLFYRYKISAVGTAMTPVEQVELVGDEYRLIKWNPATDEYIEDDEGGDETLAVVEPIGPQIAET